MCLGYSFELLRVFTFAFIFLKNDFMSMEIMVNIMLIPLYIAKLGFMGYTLSFSYFCS